MDEIIAYCGFNCSQCPSFQATMKNDTAALESIARKWPSNSIRITAKGMARLFGNTPLKNTAERTAPYDLAQIVRISKTAPSAMNTNVRNSRICCRKPQKLQRDWTQYVEVYSLRDQRQHEKSAPKHLRNRKRQNTYV